MMEHFNDLFGEPYDLPKEDRWEFRLYDCLPRWMLIGMLLGLATVR